MPLPPKPVDIADNKDARQGTRRDAAHVMDKNAQAFKKSCRTRMTMDAVEKYKDRERFYLPWSFDYRGRAYPIPAFLTPQDTDFGKSLYYNLLMLHSLLMIALNGLSSKLLPLLVLTNHLSVSALTG